MIYKKHLRKIFEFGVLLSIIQVLPVIFDNYYEILRIASIAIIGITFVMSLMLPNKERLSEFEKLLLATTIFLFILNLLEMYLKVNNGISMQLIIPFILIFISKALYNEKQIMKFASFYSITSIISIILNVLYYNEGFSIGQTYNIASKNQLGVMLSNSIIVLSVLTIKSINKQKILSLIILLSGTLTLLVLRNRSSIFGLILLVIIILLSKILTSKKSLKYIGFAIILGMVIFLTPLKSLIEQSIFNNYNIDSLDSISAGRLTGYKAALSSISGNLLIGTKLIGQSSFNPHNYILYQLYNYGFLLGMPFIILYIFVGVIMVRSIKLSKGNVVVMTTAALLALNMFVSNLEYSYPYGPGAAQLISWLLIGQTIKILDKRKDYGD